MRAKHFIVQFQENSRKEKYLPFAVYGRTVWSSNFELMENMINSSLFLNFEVDTEKLGEWEKI